MVNWDKYGLGNFQETFDSMGIESVGDLIDLAPYIENELGLEGLCDAIGVKNPEKEKRREENTRIEKKKRDVDKHKTGSSHLGIEDIIAGFFIKILIGVVILGILLLAAIGFGHYFGLLKNTMYVNLTASEESGIELQNVTAKLVSQTNGKKVVLPQVTEDGSLKFKAKYDTYELYLVYDGQEFLYYTWSIPFANLGEAHVDTDVSDVFQRVVFVRFLDSEGNVMHPENIQVDYSDGHEVSCNPLNDELYVMHIGNQAEGVSITLEVDSFKPVKVENDWNTSRICLVEVTLEHEE